jgi:hypothetical protein
VKLYWYYFDGRYHFESYCGHEWSYDPIANLVYEDYLTYEGTREIRYLTEEIPPLFRPAFEELKVLLSSIIP